MLCSSYRAASLGKLGTRNDENIIVIANESDAISEITSSLGKLGTSAEGGQAQ